MERELIEQLLDTTERVVATGAIGGNGHGNVSLRARGAEEMCFTGGLEPAGAHRERDRPRPS